MQTPCEDRRAESEERNEGDEDVERGFSQAVAQAETSVVEEDPDGDEEEGEKQRDEGIN